jgi:hypothetical protein
LMPAWRVSNARTTFAPGLSRSCTSRGTEGNGDCVLSVQDLSRDYLWNS